MSRFKYILLRISAVFIIAILSISSYGQDNKQLANQLIDIAEEIMENTKAMDQARESYVQAATFDPENIKANFFAGEYHLLTVHKELASKYFVQVKSLDEEYRFDIDYKIGLSYQYGLEFQKAIQYYQSYIDRANDDQDYDGSDFVPIDMVERKIEECKRGMELKANPVNVKITNLGPAVNSEFDDFAPMFNEDESILVFTSRRREDNQNEDVHHDNKPYEDIFYSNQGEEGWEQATNLGENINSESHDSNLAMSADGTELYVYKGDQTGDFFITTKNNRGLWVDPVRVDENIDSRDFSETSLTLSRDGNLIIFTSNRPFGKGSLDLWYSTRNEDNQWSVAKNLSPDINTEYDEDGPFLAFDSKTLYFSSDGHNGMGGQDIYKTVYDSTSQTWSEPMNLGYPINTADNDIYYITSRDGERAYYASVRLDGFGHTDIYEIAEADPEVLVTNEKKPTTLSILVKDVISGDQIDAKVELKNTADNSIVPLFKTGVGTFDFQLENEETSMYRLEVQKAGYIFELRDIQVPGMKEEAQVLRRTVALRKPVVNTRRVLRNVYFHFDRATFKDESMTELNMLNNMLKENATMRVEISGHTDNIGPAAYNKELSQKRADAIRDYLIGQGISAARIEAMGYGEERPLASNDDEREGREINRRVEFKVIK